MDVTANSTLTAEMLAIVADTTRIPERVQLELLKDAIRVEELGVTRPADECAEQATSLPSITRDQIAALQQKDGAVARLKHYLDLGRKPSRAERKQETRAALQLVSYLDDIADKDGVLYKTAHATVMASQNSSW